jgi:hypothetical protein
MLQAAGIVSSRLMGTIRRVELNRTWFCASELRVFLRQMAQGVLRVSPLGESTDDDHRRNVQDKSYRDATLKYEVAEQTRDCSSVTG